MWITSLSKAILPLIFSCVSGEFKKEETLLFLLSYLIQNYGKPFESCIPGIEKHNAPFLYGIFPVTAGKHPLPFLHKTYDIMLMETVIIWSFAW